MVPFACAEVRLGCGSIFRDVLLAESGACIIGLVLVEFLGQGLARGGLWKGPARHVLLQRRVR